MGYGAAVQKAVSAAVKAVGTEVSVTLIARGAYDPALMKASETPTTETVKAGVAEYAKHLVDGTAIQAGDLQVIVSGGDLTLDPKTLDGLAIAGVPHRVVRIQPIYAGDVIAAYEIQARR